MISAIHFSDEIMNERIARSMKVVFGYICKLLAYHVSAHTAISFIRTAAANATSENLANRSNLIEIIFWVSESLEKIIASNSSVYVHCVNGILGD